ncbi:MAG TPA: kelch repeat-containing protein, partial [Vicinamibacterales bacterium]
MRHTIRTPEAWVLAVVLAGGLFVLAGGLFVGAEAPHVPSGTWEPTGAMSQARIGASAALLSDGTVLIAGGDGAAGPSADVERYDINTGVFSAAAPMSIARSHHASVVLQDGRVLVAGGTTAGSEITQTAELYDPASNVWSAAGAMAEARLDHTASLLLDGRVLIAGGQTTGGVSDSLEIFDPASNGFASAGTLSEPRTDHASAVLKDGRVLIAGGSDGNVALSSVDLFDPGTASASRGPDLLRFREGASATTLLDGRVLIAGGHGPQGDEALGEIYDPASHTFSSTSNWLPTPRRDHLAFLLPHNNHVLIVGGTAKGTDLSAAELYAPWTDFFIATGSMSIARGLATGSPLAADGLLLVAGGNASTGAELYGFATLKTDMQDYAPGETVTITGAGWEPGETVTMVLQEVPQTHEDRTLTATADDSGNIFNNEFQPEEHDAGVRFYLTAFGELSQAQTAFTDVAKIEYSSFEGEIAPQGSDNWTTGSISGYKEGDTIRFRIKLSSLTAGQDGHLFVGFTSDPACRFFAFEPPTNIAVDFNTATDTIDAGTGFTATFGGLTQSGADAVADFHLVSSMPSASEVRLNFTLHLSDEAAACASGSSQHVQVDHATGDIKESGKKSLPIPASAVAPVTDITVSKNAPASATLGDAISYDITVTNLDSSTAANGVVATDTLPAGMSFVSGSWTKTNPAGSGSCSASGQTVTCSIGALAGAATASVTINVTVNNDTALCGTTQTNNVSVSTTTEESNTSNNSAQDSTDIVCNTALTLDKSADVASYDSPGDVINYSYDLTNSGNVTLPQPFTVTDNKTAPTCPATPP